MGGIFTIVLVIFLAAMALALVGGVIFLIVSGIILAVTRKKKAQNKENE